MGSHNKSVKIGDAVGDPFLETLTGSDIIRPTFCGKNVELLL
jgi:hypothetical protein